MHDVIRLKQVDHVKNEKNILSEIHHPFIVDLLWFHKDKSLLYMLFPYVCGGELFSYLRSAGRFNSHTSMFYSVEIVSALEYLHSLSIVYRRKLYGLQDRVTPAIIVEPRTRFVLF